MKDNNAVADAPTFTHRIRVYWEDTDAGGIVFYANFLKFFERARTEWLRGLGIGQQQLRERSGLIFVVGHTEVSYLRPARLDDLLEVSVEPLAPRRASLELRQRARRGDELLADSRIRIASVDAGTLRPRRIPIEIARSLE